jgi:hypothetical protein
MNRDHTLFHLREAAEELQRTIGAVESTPEYDYGEFVVAMQHLYHHLNTAWNARDESSERVAACSDGDFVRWRQFPQDLGLDE